MRPVCMQPGCIREGIQETFTAHRAGIVAHAADTTGSRSVNRSPKSRDCSGVAVRLPRLPVVDGIPPTPLAVPDTGRASGEDRIEKRCGRGEGVVEVSLDAHLGG